MSKKEVINVGIVGYGLAGSTFHAPLITSTPGLQVTCIVARSPEKRAQVRNEFPRAEVLASFDKLVEKFKEIDLAVIATPNKEHAAQAIACMQVGIPVVIDKPMAISLAEAELLIECSESTGVPLSVFQNRRWDNDFLTIKKLIADERLGKIYRLESRFERYRPQPRPGAWRETISPEEGGGLLFDLGSHLIDQATQLFGQPTQVYAECETRREGVSADDDTFIALSFPGGEKAHIWVSAVAASQGHRFRLLGSAGAYEKYGLDPQEDALRAGRTPMLDPDWGLEAREHWGKVTEYIDNKKYELTLETHPGEYQKFYEQMRDAVSGTGTVPVDPQDALNTLRIIEAARLSAQQKTPVAMSHS